MLIPDGAVIRQGTEPLILNKKQYLHKYSLYKQNRGFFPYFVSVFCLKQRELC